MIINVLQYLEATVTKLPDKTAVTDGEHGLTFGDLYNVGRAIGSTLSTCVKRNSPVLVLMEKTPEALAAFTGAVYAGCSYTPMDSRMPSERMQMIIDVLRPSALIYDSKNKERLSNLKCDCPFFLYDDICSNEIDHDALLDIRRKSVDTDILYILFTSGSTGVPKGVAIPHRAMIDFTESSCPILELDENIRFGNQVPFYFDMSTLEIYTSFKLGASIYLIPKKCFSFPRLLMDYLEKYEINALFWVPYALISLAASGLLDANRLSHLKYIYFCGEVMPCKPLNQYISILPNARYANLYGPTETTCASSLYIVDRKLSDDESLPIGVPFENTKICILMDDGTEGKKGDVGEIIIAGSGLAHGYYRNPEVTSRAFTQNPLHQDYNELVYHTGDLGKWGDDGNLIFCGRKDYQIKHQGYRIELGEIETAISTVDGIDNVCCIYDDENDRIVCYYIGDVTGKDIIMAVKPKIPSYMIPDEFIQKDEFPINLSGKIDRKLLKQQYMSEG